MVLILLFNSKVFSAQDVYLDLSMSRDASQVESIVTDGVPEFMDSGCIGNAIRVNMQLVALGYSIDRIWISQARYNPSSKLLEHDIKIEMVNPASGRTKVIPWWCGSKLRPIPPVE